MIFRFVTGTLLEACNKYVLKNKWHSIELINHGIICQIIEKSIELNFEKHILFPISAKKPDCCKTFMGHKEKEAMINTFVHSNFNYGSSSISIGDFEQVSASTEREVLFVLNLFL